MYRPAPQSPSAADRQPARLRLSMPEIRITGSSPQLDSPASSTLLVDDTEPADIRKARTPNPDIGHDRNRRDHSIGSRSTSRSDFRSSAVDLFDSAQLNTQTIASRFNIMPTDELVLYATDIEDDDDLHNPDKDDQAGASCWSGWSRRGIVNFGGISLLFIGLVGTFLCYPILAFISSKIQHRPDVCAADPMCIKTAEPIKHLSNVRLSLIDPDTPVDVRTRQSSRGKKQNLVFSDEFNRPGRTFYPGDDPFWTAVDIWYGVTHDLEWYDPDAITTGNGSLNIQFDAFANHGLDYRSGMLQSWNQMCFKGGHLEASISLPGKGDVVGFWPGFWAMGNLGRAGYAATTDGLWPYTYHDQCDYGITPNQSQPDGTSFLPGMRLPACTCDNEDHPNPGKSRGAPEIDALEASVAMQNGRRIGTVSQSLQVAPFDIFWQPDYKFVELYNRSITEMNTYQGGPFQQAISGLTNLNNRWYDGKAYQRYAFEYDAGRAGHEIGDGGGYVTWYVGPKQTWTLDPRSIGPNGNIGQRKIPAEPMSVVINFGMSAGFSELDVDGLKALMPATMRIDYVRIYQDEGSELMTCDPPGYPTTEYIKKHPEPYQNANLTQWRRTSYRWPKNSFMDGCK